MIMTPLETAQSYVSRGWSVIPVPPKKKRPVLTEWQNYRLSINELQQHFNGKRQNIGVLLGVASNGLADADLDCPEAVTLAPKFLPATNAIFGRASNRNSHWLYYSDVPATVNFNDPTFVKGRGKKENKARLLEVRSTGGQTVFPNSVHESGEPIKWEEEGEPSVIDASELISSAKRLAAACLLVRHYPREGIRQDALMALAGGLLRLGWDEQKTASFIETICNEVGDEETRLRIKTVCHTARKQKGGNKTTGFPKLATLIDKRVVERLREWLALPNQCTAQTDGTTISSKPTRQSPKKRASQGKRLLDLAEDIELFHAPDGKPYATVEINGYVETVPLKSQQFRDLLSQRFYKSEDTTPSAQGLQEALSVLSARARFSGAENKVNIRVAEHEGGLFLDLCDVRRQVVKIAPHNWHVIQSQDCPIKFRRTRGMLALPEPQHGGSLDLLWRLINVRDADRVLIAGYLISTLRPDRPFPLLALHGEQGSAKTTTARMIRNLVDPNAAGLRSEPRDTRDLAIAANNGWLVAYDNLSYVAGWLSDALCRLATGGGFATRELYTDDEEVIFNAMRPVLINGIEELAARPDLLDRALLISLPVIPEGRRRTEAEIWREYEAARACVLGALLDGVSAALANIEQVQISRLPRMADFAQWATAAEDALGFESGSFMRAYTGNREEANELALEASPIAAALKSFMFEHQQWSGTATKLLGLLTSHVSEAVRFHPSFPKKPNVLSNALRRVAPNLRANGINVTIKRSGSKGRTVVLEKSID
jgi:hypothetical protein